MHSIEVETEVECPHCKKIFSATVEVDISDIEREPHDYGWRD
jgi:protein-disulfide isomerase